MMSPPSRSLRAPLHQEVNQPNAGSEARRTRVHTRRLPRSRQEEKSTPQWEAALPRGMKEEDILQKRYETFTADNDWVQCVKGSLLGLEDRATPSKEDINTSERFMPRAAASEQEPP